MVSEPEVHDDLSSVVHDYAFGEFPYEPDLVVVGQGIEGLAVFPHDLPETFLALVDLPEFRYPFGQFGFSPVQRFEFAFERLERFLFHLLFEFAFAKVQVLVDVLQGVRVFLGLLRQFGVLLGIVLDPVVAFPRFVVVLKRAFRIFEHLFDLPPHVLEKVFLGNLLVEAPAFHVGLVDGVPSATVAERVLASPVPDVAPAARVAFHESRERMGNLVVLHRLVLLDEFLSFRERRVVHDPRARELDPFAPRLHVGNVLSELPVVAVAVLPVEVFPDVGFVRDDASEARRIPVVRDLLPFPGSLGEHFVVFRLDSFAVEHFGYFPERFPFFDVEPEYAFHEFGFLFVDDEFLTSGVPFETVPELRVSPADVIPHLRFLHLPGDRPVADEVAFHFADDPEHGKHHLS